MTRRPRQLSREERELWSHIQRATVPLKGRPKPSPEPAPISAPTEIPADPPRRGLAPGKFKQTPGAAARAVPDAKAKAAPAKPAPPLVPLERKAARALARGRTSAEAVIDLHGMTQAEAHGALVRFLYGAHAAGHAIVLVVTGKGVVGEGYDGAGRGVLRRMVPHWLTLPELRPIVLGLSEAGPRQGGGGALYVRLRRGRARG
jgi:DNA-nicking Smr family endonuclease